MSVVTTSPGMGRQLLHHLARRHANRQTVALLLPTVLVLLAGWSWFRHWPRLWPAAGAGLIVLLTGAGMVLYRLRHWSLPALVRRLDRLYPELEDSAGLLLRDHAHADAYTPPLNLLERLQQQRVHARLSALSGVRRLGCSSCGSDLDLSYGVR